MDRGQSPTSGMRQAIGSTLLEAVARQMWRAAIAACLAVAVVRPAGAQGPALEGGTTQIPTAPAASEFMSRFSIDWNVLGGRVLKRADTERMTLEVEAGFGGVVKHTFTDYKWVGDTDVLVRRQLGDRS